MDFSIIWTHTLLEIPSNTSSYISFAKTWSIAMSLKEAWGLLTKHATQVSLTKEEEITNIGGELPQML